MLPFTKMPRPVYAVMAVSPAGGQLYYTGKAGSGYLSHDHDEAFPFQTIEGAERKADVLRRQSFRSMIWCVVNADGDYVDSSEDVCCYERPHPDTLGYVGDR